MRTYNQNHLSEPGFKRALRLSIDRSGLTLTWVAEQVGVSLATMAAWCDDRVPQQMIPTTRLLVLLPLLHDFTCLDYLETTVGRVAERVPDPAKPVPTEAKLLREVADFIEAHASAREDGRMTPEECARVLDEGQQAMAAICAVMQMAKQQVKPVSPLRAVAK